MFTVLLVIHVLVTLALIAVVLIQRSEGGGLGIGGGQGMGSFMTGRGTANLLTRTTAILATVFLALSLLLALMTRNSTNNASSHLQRAADVDDRTVRGPAGFHAGAAQHRPSPPSPPRLEPLFGIRAKLPASGVPPDGRDPV